MAGIRWSFLTFSELSVPELYAILALRQQVFVVEQDCNYLDADGLDQVSLHIQGHNEADTEETLLACARIVAPGRRFAEPSIGRVVVSPHARGRGLGRQIMEQALDFAARHYPRSDLRLSAQSHLEAFYGGFGFIRVSDPYDEDGIPHIEMLRQAPRR